VTLTIGKIASLSKVSADTLRYYEREGLISPAGKSEGGYRLYDRDAVRRVRFIKEAQHCGFTRKFATCSTCAQATRLVAATFAASLSKRRYSLKPRSRP